AGGGRIVASSSPNRYLVHIPAHHQRRGILVHHTLKRSASNVSATNCQACVSTNCCPAHQVTLYRSCESPPASRPFPTQNEPKPMSAGLPLWPALASCLSSALGRSTSRP